MSPCLHPLRRDACTWRTVPAVAGHGQGNSARTGGTSVPASRRRASCNRVRHHFFARPALPGFTTIRTRPERLVHTGRSAARLAGCGLPGPSAGRHAGRSAVPLAQERAGVTGRGRRVAQHWPVVPAASLRPCCTWSFTCVSDLVMLRKGRHRDQVRAAQRPAQTALAVVIWEGTSVSADNVHAAEATVGSVSASEDCV